MREKHNLISLTLLLTCGGCATAMPPDVAVTHPPQAVILATRPVWDGEAAAEVVGALGHPGGRVAHGATEFIVRTAEGRLVSIVQPADAALQTGRSVVILPGPQARLAGGDI